MSEGMNQPPTRKPDSGSGKLVDREAATARILNVVATRFNSKQIPLPDPPKEKP